MVKISNKKHITKKGVVKRNPPKTTFNAEKEVNTVYDLYLNSKEGKKNWENLYSVEEEDDQETFDLYLERITDAIEEKIFEKYPRLSEKQQDEVKQHTYDAVWNGRY